MNKELWFAIEIGYSKLISIEITQFLIRLVWKSENFSLWEIHVLIPGEMLGDEGFNKKGTWDRVVARSAS